MRVKCEVEPVGRKWKHTRVIPRTNAAGEKEVSEVQIKGEKARHLLCEPVKGEGCSA